MPAMRKNGNPFLPLSNRRLFWVIGIAICALIFALSNREIRRIAKSVILDIQLTLYDVSFDARYPHAVPLQSIGMGVATGPLFVNSDNPRYFTDGTKVNGKYRAIYLTGSHTWPNLIDDGGTNPPSIFNYTAYLDFLVANNHNFFRLWRAENARGGELGDNYWFSPMPYARSATCCAFDDGNKFDLNQFNQAYFDRMRSRIIEAGQRGIYVSIMLFDGWSIESKSPDHQPWFGHPYNGSNNINSIDGDSNANGGGEEIQTLEPQNVISLEEAYVRKVIDTVNDLDNVLYEISNESRGSANNTAWQYYMITFIKDYEATRPKKHPVGMSIPYPKGNNTDLFDSPADWIAPNGDLNNPPAANGAKVIIADTDHLCPSCGEQDWSWIWRSFTRGENPIFMDAYDGTDIGRGATPGWVANATVLNVRSNMGYTLTYANRMNLVAMTPRSDLCSTGYCLANPVSAGAEYLVYLPSGGSAAVNLSAASSQLTYEWFNPANGAIITGGSVAGGDTRSFNAPFGGDAVLYIHGDPLPTQTPAATKTKTPLGPTATRTNTPSGPTVTRTPTTTSTLDFSSPTSTSPLTFPSLTFTPPGGSTVTPSETGILPSLTASFTLTSTPVPPGGASRTFLYCIVGILISAAIIGVLTYLFWRFRQLNRPG